MKFILKNKRKVCLRLKVPQSGVPCLSALIHAPIICEVLAIWLFSNLILNVIPRLLVKTSSGDNVPLVTITERTLREYIFLKNLFISQYSFITESAKIKNISYIFLQSKILLNIEI